MKKALVYILSAVLLTAFMASCSTGLEPVEDLENTGYTIVVSGALVSRTVYTDNRGRFELTEGGFQQKITCRVTAEDQSGVYESATQEMVVSWNGTSYNSQTRTSYVNDVNFYLKKENQ